MNNYLAYVYFEAESDEEAMALSQKLQAVSKSILDVYVDEDEMPQD